MAYRQQCRHYTVYTKVNIASTAIVQIFGVFQMRCHRNDDGRKQFVETILLDTKDRASNHNTARGLLLNFLIIKCFNPSGDYNAHTVCCSKAGH